MHSPDDRDDSGNSRLQPLTTQDTLDAFMSVSSTGNGISGEGGTTAIEVSNGTPGAHPDLRQESIDAFTHPGPQARIPERQGAGSRAMEGLAKEMEIERVALAEAASGISRDELLITIAREVKILLEDLDLIDAYLTDMELEGLVRRVGELVVLSHHDDGDLLAMDLSEREFLAGYRRRYMAPEGGGGR